MRGRSVQSQRDCVFQPRVAVTRLRWENVGRKSQPQRACGLRHARTGRKRNRHNRVAVDDSLAGGPKVGAGAPILGCTSQSLWDCQRSNAIRSHHAAFSSGIPRGFRPKAQGCRNAAVREAKNCVCCSVFPWENVGRKSQPQRGCDSHVLSRLEPKATTPLGLMIFDERCPKVVPMGRDNFGL